MRCQFSENLRRPKEDVVAMHKAGKRPADIARAVGTGHASVDRVLAEAGAVAAREAKELA